METTIDNPIAALPPKLSSSSSQLSSTELFELLRSYTTRLEVQLMIDESIKRLEHGPAVTEKLVRQIIADEMERHLSCTAQTRPQRVAVRLPLDRAEGEVVEGANASGLPYDEEEPNQMSPQEQHAQRNQYEEAKRQREHILRAIRDVEHQVNALQRQVNELSHQHRRAHRLLERLCSALESDPSDSPHRGGLLNALLAALDADALHDAQSLLARAMEPLIRTGHRSRHHTPPPIWRQLTPPSAQCRDLTSTTVNRLLQEGESVCGGRDAQMADGPHPYAARRSRRASAACAPPPFLRSAPTSPVGDEAENRGAPSAIGLVGGPSLGVSAVDAASDTVPPQLAREVGGGGVRVLSLVRGGAAERSGVQPGDVIFAINRRSTPSCAKLAQVLAGEILRGGAEKTALYIYRHTTRSEVEIPLLI